MWACICITKTGRTRERTHFLFFLAAGEDHIHTKTALTVPAHIFLILRPFQKMWLVAAERWFNCQKAWRDSDSYSAINMKRYWKRLYRFNFLNSDSFVTTFLCYFKITLSKKALQEDKEGCVTESVPTTPNRPIKLVLQTEVSSV